METVQRCKQVHMPGKERKRRRGINSAAHNGVEIEGSRYVITYITGFRLGHKWNRTTMGDNTVTGLVTIAVLSQGIAMAYANLYCVSGKAGYYVWPTKPWSASCRLKPKEQTQLFYLIQTEQWSTATGGANVKLKANANPVTLSCV